MKVFIGKYCNWVGPYQVAKVLKLFGCSDETVDKFAQWLPSRPFEVIDSWKHRKVKVTIHEYDTWSMDNTLAYIILPMLKQLKETKHGSPYVEDTDVPEEIRKTSAPPVENEWDTDDFFHKRWDYVLDEMIFAFESQFNEWEDKHFSADHSLLDTDAYVAETKRIANGFRLFGTYYTGLWD